MGPLQEYPTIELQSVPLHKPTSLYSLEPVGLGSAHVESLTSFVARLAAAHHVHVTDLIRRPLDNDGFLLPRGRDPSKLGGMNGMNELAAHSVERLEAATGRSHLALLTCLPLADAFISCRLLKSTQQWCPYCLQDWYEHGATIYEPLSWSLNATTVCLRHGHRLEHVCPTCHHEFRVLLQKSSPGFCGRCSAWLGRAMGHSTSDDVAGDSDMALAKAVDQLLGSWPDLWNVSERLGAQLTENLWALSSVIGPAEMRRVTHSVGTRTLRRWRTEKTIPSFSVFLRLGRELAISPAALLLRDVRDIVSVAHSSHHTTKETVRAPRDDKPPIRYSGGLTRKQAVAKAEDIIAHHDFRSRLEPERLAEQVGCSYRYLKHCMPGLRRRLDETYISLRIATIKQEMATSEKLPMAMDVAREIGVSREALKRFDLVFYQQLTGRDSWRERFEELLDLTPPLALTTVAERLGVSVPSLKTHASDLCARLADQRQRWKAAEHQLKIADMRRRFRQALDEWEDRDEVPVPRHRLRQRLGVHYRDRYFLCVYEEYANEHAPPP